MTQVRTQQITPTQRPICRGKLMRFVQTEYTYRDGDKSKETALAAAIEVGYTQEEAAEIINSADGFPMGDDDLDEVTGGEVVTLPLYGSVPSVYWYYFCERCHKRFGLIIAETNPRLVCDVCGGKIMMTSAGSID